MVKNLTIEKESHATTMQDKSGNFLTEDKGLPKQTN